MADMLGVGKALEGVSKTVDIVLAEPVRTLLGPAGQELGGMLGDQIRSWRDSRRLALAVQAVERIKAKGLSPRAVDPSILFPLLDAGSLVEDESLKAKWEAMLANAADPTSHAAVQPAFPALLSQLSPIEVRLLDILNQPDVISIRVEPIIDSLSIGAPITYHVFTTIHDRTSRRPGPTATATVPTGTIWPLLDNMVRLHVVEPRHINIGDEYLRTNDYWTLEPSPLGRALYKSCKYDE